MPVTDVSPLHQAMKVRVAKAMLNRYDALLGAMVDLVEAGEADPDTVARDPALIALEAKHDQQVLTAVRAFQRAGGRIYDHLVEVPRLLNSDRPEVSASLVAFLEFRGAPTDIAHLENEPGARWTHCYVDGRHVELVLEFLANYYRRDEASFEVKPLAPERWTIPGLPNDQAAARFLGQNRDVEDLTVELMG